MCHFAQFAALDELRAFLEVRSGPLLCADLHDTVRLSHDLKRLHHRLEGVRERLLEVDVLTGIDGVDEHRTVPVIRRRDQHGVDIVSLEQLPVVLGRRDRSTGLGRRHNLHALVEVVFADVADRDELGVRLPQEQAHDVPATAAGSDEREANPVVGALRTRPRGRRRGTGHSRYTGSPCREIDEFASADLAHALSSKPFREFRVSNTSASLSALNVSVLPLNVSDRPTRYEMFARCASEDDRWPSSRPQVTSDGLSARIASTKFW